MNLELAKTKDAIEISQLLNIAYRGDQGWTTENKLVLGDRCTTKDIENEIESEDSHYLIYRFNNRIEACISVQKDGNCSYIGSFSVLPELQNNGLGTKVLQYAESFCKDQLEATTLKMFVLTNRDELIAYYERRGYQRNGVIKSFPVHLNVGTPVNTKQTMEELVKYV